MAPPVGLLLGAAVAPNELLRAARMGDELGFSELWFGEDCFFTGGIAGAAAALSATDGVPIGVGVVPAVARQPAILAMEIATLAQLFPGRIIPAIGLGAPSWMRQMRVMPKSSLTAVRECVTAVRALLDGERLSEEGRYFGFRDVQLAFPPAERVPLYMGVNGPKMLQLAGEVADGTVISILAGERYVRWAREQVAAGMAAAGRSGRHRIVAYTLFSVDPDAERARAAIRDPVAFYMHVMGADNALARVAGIEEELERLLPLGPEAMAPKLPDDWIESLAVAGDPAECAAKIRRLLDAGADTVCLLPVPAERAEASLELTAAEILPLLG